MLRAAGLLLVLTCSAGCLGQVRSTQWAGQDDLEPELGPYRLEARWSLEVGEMNGFSSLGRDASGALWSIPEREPFLVAVGLEGEASGTAGTPLKIVGVPSTWDVESLAWLEDGRVALGTETQEGNRTQDEILFAGREGGSFRVEDSLVLPYCLWDMAALGNNGIEGLCRAGRHLVAGVESVLLREGKRFAPVAVYDYVTESWSPFSVELTTSTGRLSSVACRLVPVATRARTGAPRRSSTLEVLAIERHFDVARIIRFELPLERLDTPPSSIHAAVVTDIATLIDDALNPEGLELYTDTGRLVIIVDNNHEGVSGPTELLVLRRIAQR